MHTQSAALTTERGAATEHSAAARRTTLEPLQVSIREAARLMAYDERTIRRLIASGDIVAAGHGRLRRVPLASLRAYQEQTRSSIPQST